MKKIFQKMVLLMSVVVMMASCAAVDSGEVGIKFKKFSVDEQGELVATPCSGWNVYNPFTTSVYKYPVFVQRKDYESFDVTSKDAAVFKMDPNIAYQLDKSKAVDIFKKYRVNLQDIEDGFMRTVIKDAYRITANRYSSDSLMSNRARFEGEVRIMLDSSLAKEGFIVTEFTSQIDPPESLSKMIEEKNAAIQSALKAENEVKEAEANAKIKIARAEGDARAMKIKADAEAYYNRTISASLSPMIVQEDWIEKWDGKLPHYQAGQNGSIMMNFK